MNDFLFFILDDGTIRKFLLMQDALQDIVALWTGEYSKFIGDDITEVEFKGNYKPDKDEVLYVTMALPDEFSNIPNNTNAYNDVLIPVDEIKTVGLYHDNTFYFQNFMNRYILKTTNIPLVWDNNTYKKFNDEKAFTIEGTVNAIYHDGKFYFRSYASARQILDLSDFYTEATNTDIDNVLGNAVFTGTDCEWMKQNCDSVMRKQIKLIKDSEILAKLKVTTKTFQSWAKKAGIPENVYNTGHLVFPKSKKQCKVILSFLNDDMFEGHFTKSIYLSNSKRKP